MGSSSSICQRLCRFSFINRLRDVPSPSTTTTSHVITLFTIPSAAVCITTFPLSSYSNRNNHNKSEASSTTTIPNSPPNIHHHRSTTKHHHPTTCATTNTPTTGAAPSTSPCTRTCVPRTSTRICRESFSARTIKRSDRAPIRLVRIVRPRRLRRRFPRARA